MGAGAGGGQTGLQTAWEVRPIPGQVNPGPSKSKASTETQQCEEPNPGPALSFCSFIVLVHLLNTELFKLAFHRSSEDSQGQQAYLSAHGVQCSLPCTLVGGGCASQAGDSAFLPGWVADSAAHTASVSPCCLSAAGVWAFHFSELQSDSSPQPPDHSEPCRRAGRGALCKCQFPVIFPPA